MRKLRVGIWLNSDIKPQKGGGFGYYFQLVNSIKKFKFTNAETVFLTNYKGTDKFEPDYVIKWKKNYLIQVARYVFSIFERIPILNKVSHVFQNLEKKNNLKLTKELSLHVDVIYYLTPSCIYPSFPYIYTFWDIGHLSTYSFPELSMNNNFEKRLLEFDSIPQKALMVFAESIAGKLEIIKYLNLNEKKILVVPIFPSEIILKEISSKKPNRLMTNSFFIFYNAQFWAHKNHYNLLIAFSYILIKYPELKLIFTGSDKGNKEYILNTAVELKIKDSIIDLGFVPQEEMKWLYLNSQGLVMPTFLGPTNIPLLEAANLGCPVACSNLPGHIEELGDYGYYFDPKNPEDIAEKTIQMVKEKQLGVIKAYNNIFNISNALDSIDKAFSEIRNIRFCWGGNDEIY